jgi:hypothetical protein
MPSDASIPHPDGIVKTAEASNQYGNDPLLSVTDTLTLLGHTEKQKSSWAAG